MINPRDVMASVPVDEHCRRAEQYFRSVEEPERLLAKPFVSLNEAPLLLYRLGLLLGGLKVGPTMRVLDFGAGTCWVAHILATLQCSVVCVDPSETALALGRRLFAMRPPPPDVAPPQFLAFDGETIPLPSGSVDRIICFDALHHVPNPARILAEFHRVLKDGGLAGFSEPGRLHSRSPVSQYEMQHFGVIENDIRLEDVKACADQAGFSGMLAAAESGFETWLDFAEAQQVWDAHVLPERWVTANLHSFHGRSTFVLQKGAYEPDSRLAEGLAGELRVDQDDFEVRAGEPLPLAVHVRNTGGARWLARNEPDIGAVKIGARVRRADSPSTAPATHRTPFPHDVTAGESLIVPVDLRLPEPGDYEVTLDLLDEQIVWFETLGTTPCRLRVTVLPVTGDAGRPGELRVPYACTLRRLSPTLLTGFAAPEPFGRWTTGQLATVDLPEPLPSSFRLTITCQAFGPNVGRDLVVQAGGCDSAVRLVDHAARSYVAAFAGVAPGTRRITFRVPAPASPRECGVGEDDRRLGIALADLRVDV